MGRVLLIASAALWLAGCGEPAGEARADGHADLACAACHQGPRGERGRATVPEARCTSCHDDGGPGAVQVATVSFPHRDHGDGGPIETTCAGCHTHASGDEPLHASVDACALCHLNDVSTGEGQSCRLCHQQPDHARLTSQGVAVSHSQLPWIEIGCVRCHYDVADPPREVPTTECSQCHEDLDRLNALAVGRDLHPIHGGLTCTACHAERTHEVNAMSSVVELVCSDCHLRVHDMDVRSETSEAIELCAQCHQGVHAAQQRLILGIRPDGATTPSSKFLAGVTCRSCHVPGPATGPQPTTAIRGQATACAGCHEQEYTRVLDWWLQGVRTRLTRTSAYLATAEGQLAEADDSVRALLSSAREMVSLVEAAGGHHNLELSDRLMREAIDLAVRAYRGSGRAPPRVPDLGRVPHAGLCSYCHYGTGDPWALERMPEDFHRSFMEPRR